MTLTSEHYDLICARDAALRRAEVAEADAAALREALEPVERHRKIGEVWTELSPREWENVRRVLNAEHAGAALLAELAAARQVVAAARCLATHANRNECAKIDTALAAYDAAAKESTE